MSEDFANGTWVDEMDRAAKAQLSISDLAEYERYKRRLIDAHDSDAEAVLRGFIWDCIERYSANETEP